MPNSHSVPRGPFAPFHATLAVVRAERETCDRARDSLVIAVGREIVAERVAALKAREFYEGEARR